MSASDIRNATKIVRKGNPTPNTHPSSDELFNAEYAKQGLQPLGIGGNTTEEDTEPNGVRYIRKDYRQRADRELSPKVKLIAKVADSQIAKHLTLKAWVTTVNNSVVAWSSFVWFFVQLPLAIMLIVTLGMVGVIEGGINSNIVTKALGIVINAFTSAAASLVGIDGNIADIANGFMLIVYVLIIIIGFISLFVAFLQYTLAMLHPLSGEKEGLKKGVFLLCLFGYSAPVFNLFPWILLWLAVIWKYPR